MEALLVAFGVILGTVTNDLSSRLRERRSDGKAANRVRTMLRVEIAQNLSLAKTHFAALKIDYAEYGEDQFYEPETTIERREFRAMRLVALPLPPWQHVMWQSQLTELTTALTQVQIERCHAHYGQLDAIANTKATLDVNATVRRSESFLRAQLEGKDQPVHRNPYESDAPELWAQCEITFDALLGAGNPLADVPGPESSGLGWRKYLPLPTR